MKSLTEFILESKQINERQNGRAELYEILQFVSDEEIGLYSPKYNLANTLSVTGSYQTILSVGLTQRQLSEINSGKLCAITAEEDKSHKISIEIVSKDINVKLTKGKIDIQKTESINPKEFNNDWYLVNTDLLQKEIDKADLDKKIKLVK